MGSFLWMPQKSSEPFLFLTLLPTDSRMGIRLLDRVTIFWLASSQLTVQAVHKQATNKDKNPGKESWLLIKADLIATMWSRQHPWSWRTVQPMGNTWWCCFTVTRSAELYPAASWEDQKGVQCLFTTFLNWGRRRRCKGDSGWCFGPDVQSRELHYTLSLAVNKRVAEVFDRGPIICQVSEWPAVQDLSLFLAS